MRYSWTIPKRYSHFKNEFFVSTVAPDRANVTNVSTRGEPLAAVWSALRVFLSGHRSVVRAFGSSKWSIPPNVRPMEERWSHEMDEVQNNVGSSDLQLFHVDEGLWDRATCPVGMVLCNSIGALYLWCRKERSNNATSRRPVVPSMEIGQLKLLRIPHQRGSSSANRKLSLPNISVPSPEKHPLRSTQTARERQHLASYHSSARGLGLGQAQLITRSRSTRLRVIWTF